MLGFRMFTNLIENNRSVIIIIYRVQNPVVLEFLVYGKKREVWEKHEFPSVYGDRVEYFSISCLPRLEKE